MARRLAISAMALALSGCASVSEPRVNYHPLRIDMAFPRIGTVSQARTGEAILIKGEADQVRGVTYDDAVTLDQFTLNPGFYPLIGEDEQHRYFSYRNVETDDGLGYILPARDGLGSWLPAPDAIRISGATGKTCLIFVDWSEKACSQADQTDATQQHLTERDLVQKLIYLGRTGNRIRLKYWETSGHSARPEASEELEFTLSATNEIKHKGAQLKVLSADETAIRYTVLQTFPTYWTQPKIEAEAVFP